MSKANDLFQTITDRLAALIRDEQAGKWSKPWTAIFGGGLPTNVTTKKAYQGINSLWFGLVAMDNGYQTNLWATYKQWASIGAQVRKGEKGTHGVKWGVSYSCATEGRKTGSNPCPTKGHRIDRHLWASSFVVFNADQVDGYEAPKADLTAPERIAAVDAFIEAQGADITYKAGDRAFFVPGTNSITVPLAEQFETTQGLYGTLLHELVHWAGDADRLDRDQRNVFGSQAYAAEELVAELGATFLAAHFGIETEPHVEHAAYLGSWLSVLESDPKNLYRAAKAAQTAVEWLLERAEAQGAGEEVEAA